MAPARLGEALDQRVGLGFEEQDPHVVSALAEIRDLPGQFGELRGGARVDAQRRAFPPARGQQIHRLPQQLQRQVVHVIVAAVLEHVERHALARAREAGDEDQLHKAVNGE
ncbi:hypothetical protein D3C83_17170 [compost metagenome]